MKILVQKISTVMVQHTNLFIRCFIIAGLDIHGLKMGPKILFLNKIYRLYRKMTFFFNIFFAALVAFHKIVFHLKGLICLPTEFEY